MCQPFFKATTKVTKRTADRKLTKDIKLYHYNTQFESKQRTENKNMKQTENK
jgi:hypothetical protein